MDSVYEQVTMSYFDENLFYPFGHIWVYRYMIARSLELRLNPIHDNRNVDNVS